MATPTRKLPLHRSLRPLIAAALLQSCVVGPKYHQPEVQSPPAYQELPAAGATDTGTGWKVAEPTDDAIHGNWWEMFGDPKLDELEQQVNTNNQTIAAAFYSLQEARALVRQAQSQYFPTLTTSPSFTRSRAPASLGRGGVTGASTTATTTGTAGTTGAAGTTGTTTAATSSIATTSTGNEFVLPFDASWTPDLWGRVRNTVRSNTAAAQASAADLENTRLTAQAELAVDYYQLRAQDSLKRILDSTVAALQDSLKLNQALFETGVGADEAVAQADVQLKSTQAQDTNLDIARAQFEHAIAVLVGQPASSFRLPAGPSQVQLPAVPVGVPSRLLERRPDVAKDERLMAQANAQIGIAKAAYFPTLTLSASGGFESSTLADWITWPNRFWSVGPALAETLFDAGLRKATVAQFQANYDATVATYRGTVLSAFQQVEDNLASLRVLSQEIAQQDAAVAAAQKFLDIATDRYKLGLDPYLDVLTAQTTLLSNQQTAVQLRLQQVSASVQLIEALGGGWDRSQLPSS
jgi:NodT family efflux transporter outer membrane factor (OMF) lipoprotein